MLTFSSKLEHIVLNHLFGTEAKTPSFLKFIKVRKRNKPTRDDINKNTQKKNENKKKAKVAEIYSITFFLNELIYLKHYII